MPNTDDSSGGSRGGRQERPDTYDFDPILRVFTLLKRIREVEHLLGPKYSRDGDHFSVQLTNLSETSDE